MKARDIMTADPATVAPDASVHDIARLMLDRNVSALPVMTADGELVGIVSEGDLLYRDDTGELGRRSWWLSHILEPDDQPRRYAKAHGRKAEHVMTAEVVTVTPDTDVAEIAHILEARRIKRVPVVDDGRLVGIVSRANLLHGLAARPDENPRAPDVSDQESRAAIVAALAEAGLGGLTINTIVTGGVAQLWGAISDEDQRRAALVAAETAPGVTRVEDHLARIPPWTYSA